MSLSTFNADMEALRAELRKKEHDLLLAARYGKNLLEENERIREDLENERQEHDKAMELIETQRRESQRSMIESMQTAEQQISEMEQQLSDLNNQLAKERATISSLKEDHLRSMEQLQAENLQLREGLAKVNRELEGEKSQHHVADLTKRLGESEKRIQQLTLESTELQKQLAIVQESNKTLSTDLSTLADSCDQLTSELVTCREEVEYWERKYRDKDKELNTCSKDLDDSQELLSQLQIELDQQSSCTPKSARSSSRTASLYDELSSSRDSLSYMGLMHNEDMSSTCGSDLAEREDTNTPSGGLCMINSSSPNLLHSRGTEVVLPEKCSQSVACGWEESDVFQCQRCQEMKEKLSSNEDELKLVNEQLLKAVQQKFKLQQQIEAWQTDMTQVVEQQVQRKLVKGVFSSSKRNSKSKSKHDPPERQLSYHMIKDSLVY